MMQMVEALQGIRGHEVAQMVEALQGIRGHGVMQMVEALQGIRGTGWRRWLRHCATRRKGLWILSLT